MRSGHAPCRPEVRKLVQSLRLDQRKRYRGRVARRWPGLCMVEATRLELQGRYFQCMMQGLTLTVGVSACLVSAALNLKGRLECTGIAIIGALGLPSQWHGIMLGIALARHDFSLSLHKLTGWQRISIVRRSQSDSMHFQRNSCSSSTGADKSLGKDTWVAPTNMI